MSVQLKSTDAVRLAPTQVQGISRVEVLEPAARHNLTWDRYVRLHAVAEEVQRCTADWKEEEMKKAIILDVGGYEGALGLFLPDFQMEVIDPATTGCSGTNIPLADKSRPIITSIDALEHISPDQRLALLSELARVTGSLCFINFPNRNTAPAQELALGLTNNQLVREHVEFGLPSSAEVAAEMERHGFACEVVHHSDSLVWASQFVLQHRAPDAAAEVSRFLIQHHRPHRAVPEPLAPLYDLVVCRRT
jgi:hypothetical protein